MGSRRVSRHAHDRRSCVGRPIGSTQTGKGRYQINARVVFNRLGKALRFLGRSDHLQLIPQPFDRCGGIADDSFQTISRPPDRSPMQSWPPFPCSAWQYSRPTFNSSDEPVPKVTLVSPTLVTSQGKQRCLRVSHHSANRNRRFQRTLDVRCAKTCIRVANLCERRRRHLKQFAQRFAPAKFLNVVQQRATGVRVIGGKDLSAASADRSGRCRSYPRTPCRSPIPVESRERSPTATALWRPKSKCRSPSLSGDARMASCWSAFS